MKYLLISAKVPNLPFMGHPEGSPAVPVWGFHIVPEVDQELFGAMSVTIIAIDALMGGKLPVLAAMQYARKNTHQLLQQIHDVFTPEQKSVDPALASKMLIRLLRELIAIPGISLEYQSQARQLSQGLLRQCLAEDKTGTVAYFLARFRELDECFCHGTTTTAPAAIKEMLSKCLMASMSFPNIISEQERQQFFMRLSKSQINSEELLQTYQELLFFVCEAIIQSSQLDLGIGLQELVGLARTCVERKLLPYSQRVQDSVNTNTHVGVVVSVQEAGGDQRVENFFVTIPRELFSSNGPSKVELEDIGANIAQNYVLCSKLRDSAISTISNTQLGELSVESEDPIEYAQKTSQESKAGKKWYTDFSKFCIDKNYAPAVITALQDFAVQVCDAAVFESQLSELLNSLLPHLALDSEDEQKYLNSVQDSKDEVFVESIRPKYLEREVIKKQVRALRLQREFHIAEGTQQTEQLMRTASSIKQVFGSNASLPQHSGTMSPLRRTLLQLNRALETRYRIQVIESSSQKVSNPVSIARLTVGRFDPEHHCIWGINQSEVEPEFMRVKEEFLSKQAKLRSLLEKPKLMNAERIVKIRSVTSDQAQETIARFLSRIEGMDICLTEVSQKIFEEQYEVLAALQEIDEDYVRFFERMTQHKADLIAAERFLAANQIDLAEQIQGYIETRLAEKRESLLPGSSIAGLDDSQLSNKEKLLLIHRSQLESSQQALQADLSKLESQPFSDKVWIENCRQSLQGELKLQIIEQYRAELLGQQVHAANKAKIAENLEQRIDAELKRLPKQAPQLNTYRNDFSERRKTSLEQENLDNLEALITEIEGKNQEYAALQVETHALRARLQTLYAQCNPSIQGKDISDQGGDEVELLNQEIARVEDLLQERLLEKQRQQAEARARAEAQAAAKAEQERVEDVQTKQKRLQGLILNLEELDEPTLGVVLTPAKENKNSEDRELLQQQITLLEIQMLRQKRGVLQNLVNKMQDDLGHLQEVDQREIEDFLSKVQDLETTTGLSVVETLIVEGSELYGSSKFELAREYHEFHDLVQKLNQALGQTNKIDRKFKILLGEFFELAASTSTSQMAGEVSEEEALGSELERVYVQGLGLPEKRACLECLQSHLQDHEFCTVLNILLGSEGDATALRHRLFDLYPQLQTEQELESQVKKEKGAAMKSAYFLKFVQEHIIRGEFLRQFSDAWDEIPTGFGTFNRNKPQKRFEQLREYVSNVALKHQTWPKDKDLHEEHAHLLTTVLERIQQIFGMPAQALSEEQREKVDQILGVGIIAAAGQEVAQFKQRIYEQIEARKEERAEQAPLPEWLEPLLKMAVTIRKMQMDRMAAPFTGPSGSASTVPTQSDIPVSTRATSVLKVFSSLAKMVLPAQVEEMLATTPTGFLASGSGEPIAQVTTAAVVIAAPTEGSGSSDLSSTQEVPRAQPRRRRAQIEGEEDSAAAKKKNKKKKTTHKQELADEDDAPQAASGSGLAPQPSLTLGATFAGKQGGKAAAPAQPKPK